jgi:hypothetical protein
MNLNETSVFGKLESSAKKFHPAMWTSFGGPGGANLRFLTSVTVIIDGDIMTNVMFQYSTGNIFVLSYHHDAWSAWFRRL